MNENTHLRNIDFFKGICALLIIFTHYKWTQSERLWQLHPLWVDIAVPMFMAFSGYVAALAFERRKIETFEQAYEVKYLLSRVIRYTVPFLIAFIGEEMILVLGGHGHGLHTIWIFLNGGFGQGSYYWPCMLQFIFLFPVIYFLIRKYGARGFILCGIINLVYEICKWAYGMNEDFYRMICLRYVLVIALGCLLGLTSFRLGKRELGGVCILGLTYIMLFEYAGLTPLITKYWTNTSMFACLFFLPIIQFAIKAKKIHFIPIETLGKASYHIFLAQMVYYNWAWHMYDRIDSIVIRIAINFGCCIVAGMLFYKIEQPITQKLTDFLNEAIKVKQGEEI